MDSERMVKEEKGEKEILRFTQKDYRSLAWVKKDKEFHWRGDLFDVIRIDSLDNSVTVTCYNDKKESNIERKITELSDHLNPNTPFKKDLLLKVMRLMTSTYLLSGQPLPHVYSSPDNLMAMLIFLYDPIYTSVPSPPPRIL